MGGGWICGIKSGRKTFRVQAAENVQKDGKSWTMVVCGVSIGQQRDNPVMPRIPRTIFSTNIWKVWLVVRFSYELFMD